MSDFNIPEGKKLKKMHVICEKHGEITESANVISLKKVDKDGNETPDGAIICMSCLAELIRKLQDDEKMAKISLAPEFEDTVKEEKDEDK